VSRAALERLVKQEVTMRFIDRRVLASVVCLALGSMFFVGSVFAQSDPAVGTWKLNPAKSRYSPGPVPKSNVITIVAVENGLKVSGQGMDAAGKPTSINYTVTYDGKEKPVTGSPDYDSTSGKRINASTTEQTRKREGKMVQTQKREVSADGKTMTITTRGKDKDGKTINNVAVFDKQ
jgi:hypothetical protein